MPSHGSYCSVSGCSTNIRDNISFFRCPKDAKRSQQWKEALGFDGEHKYAKLTPEEAYSRIRVCIHHFDDKSFTSSGKRLLNTAVPSKFLPISDGRANASPLFEVVTCTQRDTQEFDQAFKSAKLTLDEENHAESSESHKSGESRFQHEYEKFVTSDSSESIEKRPRERGQKRKIEEQSQISQEIKIEEP